jgi:propanol-preferring alcohol dehydrogenase
VTNLTEGNRVAVPWLGWACGACEYCASGWETLCLQQRNTGYSVDGGYADYVIAEANFVGRVPDGIDPIDAAPSHVCRRDDLQGRQGLGSPFI